MVSSSHLWTSGPSIVVGEPHESAHERKRRDPLIPHQSTWAREALGFQGLSQIAVEQNLLWDVFGQDGVEND